MENTRNKWTSRKFWLTVIAAVFTMIATFGFDAPIEEVIVTDVVIGVWVLIEGIIDAVKK